MRLLMGFIILFAVGTALLFTKNHHRNQKDVQFNTDQIVIETAIAHNDDLKQESDSYSLKEMERTSLRLIENLNKESEHKFQHLKSDFSAMDNAYKLELSSERRTVLGMRNYSAVSSITLPKYPGDCYFQSSAVGRVYCVPEARCEVVDLGNGKNECQFKKETSNAAL